MQVKKYIADNYNDALAQVKREMGSEALILTTRSLREKSEFEGRSASKVEITAAIDPSAVEEQSRSANPVPEPAIDFSGFAEETGPNLKNMLFSLLSQTERAQALGLKSDQFEWFSHLVENGVNERIVSKLLAKSNFSKGSAGSASEKNRLIETMKRVIVCRGGIETHCDEPPKKVALVGPTGAGKTTTVAKIAADLVYRQQKKVALVSLDTYRIGGIEQLNIYGDIMNLPVEAAQGRHDLEECVRRHADKDVILIDTMGRCHKDRAYTTQLAEVFQGLGKVETHLVLSVGSQEKLFSESYKQFSPLGVDRVLFTKLDEGLNYGSMLNFSLRTRLGFSYFTTGQHVPEDIEVAARDRVIRLIFN